MSKTLGKILALMTAVALVFLAGCGPQSGPASSSETKGNTEPAAATQNAGTTAEKPEEQGKEIKIGLVLAETGPASTLGMTEVQTARLIQKQLDAQGPINGNTIKLIVQDYETDDTKAVVAMDRLLAEGVVAVVGATQVSTTAAILPKAVQARVPLMTVAPANPGDADSVYVMTPSSETVAQLMKEWVEKNNIKRVAWVNAKDAFGVEGKPFFEEMIKGTDIEIVAHEEFDATATDMTVQLTNVRKQNPELVVVWSRTPGAGIVARNFKSLGFEIPMLQSTASANQGFLEQVKDNNSNIYVIGSKLSVVDQMEDSDQKKRLLAFRDAFKAEFNAEPDLFAAHAHDGISMIIEAVKAGYTTAEEIITFLNTELGPYPGITGTYDFSISKLTSQPDGLSVLSIENNYWKYME